MPHTESPILPVHLLPPFHTSAQCGHATAFCAFATPSPSAESGPESGAMAWRGAWPGCGGWRVPRRVGHRRGTGTALCALNTLRTGFYRGDAATPCHNT